MKTFLVLSVVLLGVTTKDISIEKVEIDIDPNYIKVAAKIQPVGGINTIDLDVDIVKDEADVEYQVSVWRHNVDHYEHFYKSEMENGCAHGSIKDPVLSFMFKESMKFGNITEACPFKSGHYQLRNFKIESSDMPHELAPGNYRFEFSAYVKKDGKLHEIYTDKYYFTAS